MQEFPGFFRNIAGNCCQTQRLFAQVGPGLNSINTLTLLYFVAYGCV